MKRRSFVRWGIWGVIVSRFFASLSSVMANNDSPTQFYQVGKLQTLETEGFLLNEDVEIGAVLVMYKEDKSLMAIDPTCTHAGCLVEWQKEESSFICPCHQSKFKQDGTLIEGLAIDNLATYQQVKIENDLVFVAQ